MGMRLGGPSLPPRREHLWASLILYTAAALGVVAWLIVTSPDAGANTGTCSGTHLAPIDDESFTYTAPDGFLISHWCVKAGSIHQGLGPEEHDENPPVASITVEHSSGKDISHWSVTVVPVGTTTVPPTTSTTAPSPTTTVPVTPPVTPRDREPELIPPIAIERPAPVVADPTFTG